MCHLNCLVFFWCRCFDVELPTYRLHGWTVFFIFNHTQYLWVFVLHDFFGVYSVYMIIICILYDNNNLSQTNEQQQKLNRLNHPIRLCIFIFTVIAINLMTRQQLAGYRIKILTIHVRMLAICQLRNQ
jgi:hypothetical protein